MNILSIIAQIFGTIRAAFVAVACIAIAVAVYYFYVGARDGWNVVSSPVTTVIDYGRALLGRNNGNVDLSPSERDALERDIKRLALLAAYDSKGEIAHLLFPYAGWVKISLLLIKKLRFNIFIRSIFCRFVLHSLVAFI